MISPDLHAQQTASNLAALLLAPINSYQSVLTLLALPSYAPLLSKQLYSTRRSLAHSIVSSVLKNETIIETPEDVDGVLELCGVLIKDQSDVANAPLPGSGAGAGGVGLAAVNNIHNSKEIRRQAPHFVEREEMAEEQGWVARMVHLFRAESLDVQFEVRLCDAPVVIANNNAIAFLAIAGSTETFRGGTRTNEVYFPCTNNFRGQALSPV